MLDNLVSFQFHFVRCVGTHRTECNQQATNLDSDSFAVGSDGFQGAEEYVEYEVGFSWNDAVLLRDGEVIAERVDSRQTPSHWQQRRVT